MTEEEFRDLAEMYFDCAMQSVGKLASYYTQQMWKVLFLAEGYDGDFFDRRAEQTTEGQKILESVMEGFWRQSEESRYGSCLYRRSQ
jgi:hypothetical protein